jgi:hypothetical protein
VHPTASRSRLDRIFAVASRSARLNAMDSIDRLFADPGWWFTAVFIGVLASPRRRPLVELPSRIDPHTYGRHNAAMTFRFGIMQPPNATGATRQATWRRLDFKFRYPCVKSRIS